MKISSVDLSKITTYRFGGVCKSFIELADKEDLNNLDEILLGKENVIIGKGSNGMSFVQNLQQSKKKVRLKLLSEHQYFCQTYQDTLKKMNFQMVNF